MGEDMTESSEAVPTLADVARTANVSTATVSRCLNSPGQVSAKTHDKVMRAVDALGYSPNFSARALAARQTKTVGAIIPTMDNAIFARGIQAFQEELREHGFTLLIASSAYQEDQEEEQIKTLTARGADGLLLIGYHRDSKIYDFLEKRRVPVLLAWVFDPNADRIAIGFNNRQAMKELATEVLAHGHRRLGFISAFTKANDRARDRVQGVYDAIKAAGMDADSVALIETKYSIEYGAEAFRALMAGSDRPTAVMCGNDVLAVGALRAAIELGLNVPGDVSITGFDDIELASVAPVPLTTIHVPHRRMGRQAARMLIDMLAGKTPTKGVELEVSMCLRETLGPAPG
ncbi:MAG: LacI family DNA-binding transcriptional regulator [Roseibium sp.]|nr:LacI family DNA-binding transcriptional regulator [Roseibium sp.]